MLRVLTAAEMRSAEEITTAGTGVSLATLMAAAGDALASVTLERVPDGDLVVVAGPGNNGGDGWVAARQLHEAGRTVRVASLKSPELLTGEAAAAASAAIAAGVVWVHAASPSEFDLGSAAGIVDALLGIGASGAPRPEVAEWIDAMNLSDAILVSADIPTGVDADSGAVPGVAVRADVTVTFGALKRGLVTFPGAGYVGDLVLADVGIPEAASALPATPEVWTAEEYSVLVPRPAADVHKNQRGRVLVVAGSGTYPGAAILAARGAARAGAGYVTLAVPDAITSIAQNHLVSIPVVGLPSGRTGAFLSAALERLLHLARDFDAVVLGPGLTLADGAVVTARGLVKRLPIPMVIDADALNALVDARGILEAREVPTVLTPHPGELGRLLSIPTAAVQRDRISSSAAMATALQAVVLKGAGTVTSGDGRQVINTSGTPALATAGTGDVLAGIIGALLANGLDPLHAGALGAYVHGRAGEAAASVLTPLCVTAEDVLEYLPTAFGEVLGEW